ncbi:MAG: Ig domain-containing protein [Bryobacteraceae bacterium]
MAFLAPILTFGQPDKVTTHVPQNPRQFVSWCALWRADGEFRSTIRLSNQLLVSAMDVQVTLYMADGTAYGLPAVRLAEGAVSTVDITDALGRAPASIRPRISDFGSAAVSYTYDWQGAVYASMSMLNLAQSLEYTPPCTFSPSGASAANSASGPQVLQGLWWKHLGSLDGFVALANTTGQPLAVSVLAAGSQPAASLVLPPHGTSLSRLPELLPQSPSTAAAAGGLDISYTGRPGDLQVAGGLEEPAQGFSLDMPIVRQTAAQGIPAQQRYAAAGVMVGQQQADLNFPAGVSFSPFAFFRNLASSPRQLRFEVYYMEGTRTVGSLPVAPLTLAGGGSAELPLSSLTSALTNTEALNLAYSYQGSPGDILASIGSTDQSGSYVFPVRAEPVGPSGSKTSVYWQLSNGFDSMYTLWNPDLTDADFLVTLRYNNGTGLYEMPVHLVPHESAMIDVGELVRQRIPDYLGRLLPLSPIEGSLLVSGPQNGPEDMIDVVLAEGIYNPGKATCGGGCVVCNGYTSACFDPVTGILVPPAGNQQGQLCYNFYNGSVYWITTSANWSSSNPSVATVQTHGQASPGLTTGVSPGTASIFAQSASPVPVNAGQVCSSQPITCPSTPVSSGATATVAAPQPDHLVVSSDMIQALSCPSGKSGLVRYIGYNVVDVGGNQVNNVIQVDELLGSKTPSDGTSSCDGQKVGTTETCGTVVSGSFGDGLSSGCGATPGCGFSDTQQWNWCGRGGSQPDQNIGTVGQDIVHNDSISVRGNTNGSLTGTSILP